MGPDDRSHRSLTVRDGKRPNRLQRMVMDKLPVHKGQRAAAEPECCPMNLLTGQLYSLGV